MAANLPTASRLERAFACEASRHLPVIEKVGGEYQTQGSVVHGFLEACRNVGRDEALASVHADYRELCANIDLSLLPVDPGAYAAEVAFAWDVETDTARELGRGIGRNYTATPTEFCGTADVIALLDDDGVKVCDYKPRWSPNVTPAARNIQLRALALFAARTYKRSRAEIQIVHVGVDGAYFDTASLDAFDLDSVADDLRRLYLSIHMKSEGPATEGRWCDYCGSVAYCPAKANLAIVLGSGKIQIPPLTGEVAAQAWEKIRAARKLLDGIEAQIEAFARVQPVDLPNGRRLEAREMRRETIDGDAALPVLQQLGINVGKWSVSKTDISKAAGKDKAEDVLAALRAAGALKITITNPVSEVKAR